MSSHRRRTSDHPRIRGEHAQLFGIDLLDRGSSPHTRGAPGMGAVQKYRGGIIPAYAGSTVISVPGVGAATDHPRIRGEHSRASRSDWT